MQINPRFTTACMTSALLALASGCTSSPISRPNPFVHPDPFFLGEAPFVQTDPLLDGKAASREEWVNGVRLPDIFYAGPTARAGFYYFESRESWQATSVRTAATTTYPGHTQFIAHDLVGSSDPTSILHHFQLDEDNDWNSFRVVTPSGNVTIWVFDDQDDPDDSDWLPAAEGLDRSRLLTASSGMVVRANRLAPARRSRAIATSVVRSMRRSLIREPLVERRPRIDAESLTASGRPSSRRRRPSVRAYFASAVLARSIASSK